MTLGIDFGTCFSSIALYSDINKKPLPVCRFGESIWDKDGNIPTVFYNEPFPHLNFNNIIGQPALEAMERNDFKRYGIRWIKKRLVEECYKIEEDEEDVIQVDETDSFEIRKDISEYEKLINKEPLKGIGTNPGSPYKQTLNLKEITILIIKGLIEEVKNEILNRDDLLYEIKNKKLEIVVIAVPAIARSATYRTLINDCTKEALNQIGDGEAEVYLIDEPVAAALSYFNNENRDFSNGECILVYELGGGTFDTAIVECNSTIPTKFQILPLMQDGCKIGGNNWDKEFKKHIESFPKNQFLKIKNSETKKRIDIKFNKAIVAAKIRLSDKDKEETHFFDEFFDGFSENSFDKIFIENNVLSRNEFETIKKISNTDTGLLEQTITAVKNLIKKYEDYCKKNNKDAKIDKIVLSGGASRMIMIKKRLDELKEELYLTYPDLEIFDKYIDNNAVSLGAAIYANELIDLVSPHTYGILLRPEKRIPKQFNIENLIMHNDLVKKEGIKKKAIAGIEDHKSDHAIIRVCETDEEDTISIGIIDDNDKIISIGKKGTKKDLHEIRIELSVEQKIKKPTFYIELKLCKGGILEVCIYEGDKINPIKGPVEVRAW